MSASGPSGPLVCFFVFFFFFFFVFFFFFCFFLGGGRVGAYVWEELKRLSGQWFWLKKAQRCHGLTSHLTEYWGRGLNAGPLVTI